jgi:NTE family protein
MGERPKVGLALGGGGARGFAHLGVLIALEESRIPADVIAGSSMGAAVGAAKALGMDLQKLARLLGSLDLNNLFHVSGSTMREIQRAVGRGMVEYMRGTSWREEGTAPEKLARMYEFFSLLTAKRSFSDTVLPFAVVATDLESGEKVVLNEGKIYQAVTASAAVPGVFYPVRHGGRFLVDGGLVDKVPVDIAIDLGAEVVIAVDTGAPLSRRVNTSLDALLQAERITSQHLQDLQLQGARTRLGGRLLLLQPEVQWINMFGFEHITEAIAAGKKEALAHLGEIAELCELASPSSGGSTERTAD